MNIKIVNYLTCEGSTVRSEMYLAAELVLSIAYVTEDREWMPDGTHDNEGVVDAISPKQSKV